MSKQDSEALFLSQKQSDDVLVDENGLTQVITYNLKDTGRRLTQSKRNYDIDGAVILLNSPTVQEGVANGDYFGYFGHWIRELLGLDPQEGGFVDGKLVLVEPALVLKKISAKANGDVSFQVQFLDTPMGNMARRIYSQKKGGFSIVWDFYRQDNGSLLPYQLWGMDMVLTPNFTKNRGYVMDAASRAALGSVLMDSAQLSEFGSLIAPLFADLKATKEENTRLSGLVEDLTIAIARHKPNGYTAMDSKTFNLSQVPSGTSSNLTAAQDFLSSQLAEYQKVGGDDEPPKNTPLVDHILSS